MTQLSGVTPSPALPQPVAAPLPSLAGKPFAYVLRGLVEAQLVREGPAAPEAVSGPERPVYPEITVGKNGAMTIGAFTLKERILAPAE